MILQKLLMKLLIYYDKLTNTILLTNTVLFIAAAMHRYSCIYKMATKQGNNTGHITYTL